MAESLEFTVRTAREIVLQTRVRSARVPTQSGQVGLRPRAEPFVLLVDPGLVLLRTDARLRFAATAGGLLEGRRDAAVLFTPFAVVSDEASEVETALAQVLATPDGDIALRRRLDELEQRIVRELQDRRPAPRTRASHD